MGLITDYASLQTEVADLIVRTDMTETIKRSIQVCEAQMRRRLQAAGVFSLRTRATDTLTIADEYASVPGDYQGDFSMEVYDTTQDPAAWIPLDPISPNAHAALLADRDATNGVPTSYCLLNGQFAFSPIPDAAYQVRLLYAAGLASLSVTNTTNWVLIDHPDAYLYGAAMQTAPELVEDDRLTTWGQLFTTAVADIIAAEKAKIGSRLTPLYRANLPLPRRSGFNINTGR